jgi:hypothetical protein
MTNDPQRSQRGAQTPGQGSGDLLRSQSAQSGSRGGTMTAEPQTRTYQTTGAQPPARAPKNRTRPLVIGGLAGLVALGGIVAGFAASNNPAPTLTPGAGAIRHVPVQHAPARVPVTGARHLLASVGGAGGARVSHSFTASSNTVVAHYAYSCSAGQGSSRFGAGLVGTSGGGNQLIANTTGTSGTRWVTLHAAAGHTYRLTAGSACPFRVTVYNHR